MSPHTTTTNAITTATHTSAPHPPLPSHGHPSLSAGGEARVLINPHPFQRRGLSVISGLSGPWCEK
ncbi:hypothetical protein M405DRAFT_833613 [Rhizopogon salebrosus TDB-379]|nr:hypothetical protein M405DRAFT_833613 [Rhizopogon salebrosus TDB-379]